MPSFADFIKAAQKKLNEAGVKVNLDKAVANVQAGLKKAGDELNNHGFGAKKSRRVKKVKKSRSKKSRSKKSSKKSKRKTSRRKSKSRKH